MSAFRKKPVVIEAVLVRYSEFNPAIEDWEEAFEGRPFEEMPDWLSAAIVAGDVVPHTRGGTDDAQWDIKTLEGVMTARSGDWIIRGIKGELYPCRPDIFAGTYEDASSAPGAVGVTLDALRKANIERQAIWCPDEVPDLSFRGNDLAGEVGEACNVIKKLERERHGWRGSRDTKEHLAEELADVVICADLCALTAGIDLAAAVVAKFNATSDKVGIPVKLTVLPSGQNETGGEVAYRYRVKTNEHPSWGEWCSADSDPRDWLWLDNWTDMQVVESLTTPASGQRNAVVEADERAELEEYRRRANLNPLSGMSWNGFNVWGDGKSMTEVKAAVHSHSQIYGFRTLIRHQREEIGKLHSQIRALKETPNV